MMFFTILPCIRQKMELMRIQNVTKNHLICIKSFLLGMFFYAVACAALIILCGQNTEKTTTNSG